jgi:very-short-patch-repair endonuclease
VIAPERALAAGENKGGTAGTDRSARPFYGGGLLLCARGALTRPSATLSHWGRGGWVGWTELIVSSTRKTHADEGRTRLDVTDSMRDRAVRSAKRLRAEATPSEQRLWAALRDRNFHGRKFRRQQPMGPFVLDFWCAEERLAVEIDGSVHDDPEQERLDRERQTMIESLDIRFVRVPAELVANDTKAALAMVAAKFKQNARTEIPLP